MMTSWPPEKAPPLEKQSQIIEQLDKLIVLHNKMNETLKLLRTMLLIGWRLAGNLSEYRHVMNEYRYEPYKVSLKARFQWERIKAWREQQP